MQRITLLGHGRTKYVLDIDPEKVRLKNRHTLLVARPEWCDDGPDHEEFDGGTLMRLWYDHEDECLLALGIHIVEITEGGRRLKRAEPWEAGEIPFDDAEDLIATLPLTLTLRDGSVRKVLIRIPDFRMVRPWGLIVSPPFGEDGEEIVLDARGIYYAALKGEYGLNFLGMFDEHTMN